MPARAAAPPSRSCIVTRVISDAIFITSHRQYQARVRCATALDPLLAVGRDRIARVGVHHILAGAAVDLVEIVTVFDLDVIVALAAEDVVDVARTIEVIENVVSVAAADRIIADSAAKRIVTDDGVVAAAAADLVVSGRALDVVDPLSAHAWTAGGRPTGYSLGQDHPTRHQQRCGHYQHSKHRQSVHPVHRSPPFLLAGCPAAVTPIASRSCPSWRRRSSGGSTISKSTCGQGIKNICWSAPI